MERQEEQKNRRIAIAVSVAVHSLLLLAFLFMIAWREPDPPLPEYGIELNFGLDNVGSGEVQPVSAPVESESEEEAAPEQQPDEVVEEVDDEPVEESSEPVEEVLESTTNEQISPDVVEKEQTPVKKTPPVETKEKVEEKKEDPKPAEQKTEKPADGAEGKDGDSKTPQNANQGDNTNKTGDKGDEKGTLDSRALYGKAGGGDGSSLEMTGWMWDFKPKPNDTSSENGRIVFEIKIDDQGEIISVRTIERSVSPAVEKIYRAEVEKLTFSRTSDNAVVAPISTGKITFVIKSK